MTLGVLLRQPSAFLPLALSLAALSTVTVHVAVFGAAREADEGTAAHIWQLLMLGQALIAAFFAIKWLPQQPRTAAQVLGLQIAAALAALLPLFILGL